uniref:RNA-binding protein NOB1 n=1 Tax=Panstrongylus lignarius TaxID=156445 RepID=A0A224XNY1_9HEMI
MPPKIENLVVDTTAFINNVQLQDIALNLFTIHEVIEEVRCKRQYRNLVVLPYDLQVKDVDAESVDFVTKFAKKTGDYSFLSATDIKLLALTYQLEKELVGIGHLRTEPIVCKTLEPLSHKGTFSSPGFYTPNNNENECPVNGEQHSDGNRQQNEEQDSQSIDEDSQLQKVPDIIFDDTVLKQFSRLTCDGNEPESNQVVADCDDKENEDCDNGEEDGEEDEDGDEGDSKELDPCITDGDDIGWITPKNSRSRDIIESPEVEEPAVVACYSTDFSIQNVLKQIGLNVVSKDGLLISNINTYILRCYACFQIVPPSSRVFCPKCGNKTLKRVSVYVDSDGKQHIRINFRRPLTARGKKFPLPRPKGGKHAVNPILCEDQRVPQQRLSKLALTKNNPMHPDYIAGISPFVMRDVSSKSAVIHANNKSDVKYWMRKNPNEVVKRRRKK